MGRRRQVARNVCKPYIKGFTTNPTLMRKAGISGYESFAARFCKRSLTARSLSSLPDDLPRWRGRHVKSRPGEKHPGQGPDYQYASRKQRPTVRRLTRRHSRLTSRRSSRSNSAGRGRAVKGARLPMCRFSPVHRRYGRRPCAVDGRGSAPPHRCAQYRAHLGQPA